MNNAQEVADQYFLEMRWRCLSLAADLDRLEQADGGATLLKNDPRLQKLHSAIRILLDAKSDRAEQVLMCFSDMTPPPARNQKS